MSKIHIFVTSENPDSYINVIAHTTEYMGVESINLIAISEHDYTEKNSLSVAQIISNINEQLKLLINNRYAKFNIETGRPRSSKVENSFDCKVYERCLDFINSQMGYEVVPHSYLEKKIRRYVDEGNCIVDVTSLKNNLLVDVISVFISYGFRKIYNFELIEKPTFDEKSLYHNLKNNETYKYRNLTDSIPVTNSLNRLNKLNAKKKSVLFFSAILFSILLPLNFYSPSPIISSTLNVVALVATIGSWFLAFTIK